jgi:methyltransferase (TIGR00027 family)
MNPISKTAFYCCGVRMRDAEGPSPVCNDIYAGRFMSDEALQILDLFNDETRPNASNVARHRMIDDFLRDELLADPNLLVVIIGAGFDSRAFRLHGGTWIELDEPQIIEYKNERLPLSESVNDVQRIAVEFSTDSLEEKLRLFSKHERVVVIIEGVFMYLEQSAITTLLQTLNELFPRHKLVCDLMTWDFFENNAKTIHEKITGMGTSFKLPTGNPEEVFLGNGYQVTTKLSIVEQAVMFGSPGIPKGVLDMIVPSLPVGYSIYVFEKG